MYNKDKLIDAIWGNPEAVTGLHFELINGGKEWAARQYPDGTDGGKRRDRTTLKCGVDRSGDRTIWVHCNGDFGAFPHGDIWGFLHWRFNTNEHIEVLQRVGDAYGIKPDLTGYSEERRERARQRMSEKAIIQDIAAYLLAVLRNSEKGERARAYIAGRGLKVTERIGAWNSEVKAELLPKIIKKYNITTAGAEALLNRLFPTNVRDYTTGEWRDYIDAYQLAIPYTNGAGNVMGFILRDIANTPELSKRKYTYSKGMPRGGYCGALKGGETPVILVEGILDAEAMKQNGFENVVALGGQTPTDNAEDEAKSTIQTLLRYNAKKLIYIPDYEYKEIKDGSGNVVGVEDYPTTDATRRTIAAILPHMTGRADGSGFVSLRIADLATADAKKNKTKVDADTFLKVCSIYGMQRVLDDAAAWYEYELKAVVQKHGSDADEMTAAALDVYGKINNIAQRNRLKEAITAAQNGYLARIKEAGLNAAALSMIDKYGQKSTWAERMAAVVGEMGQERTAEGMEALLTKANRIQHADTFNAFAAQVNITREEMHQLVAQKPVYLETSWGLYRRIKSKATGEFEYKEIRKISFAPAAVSIVAAPTNHGKTLILLQTAINAAKATGKKYIYLSFENDAEQLYIRALTAYMGFEISADEENPRGKIREFIRNEDLPPILTKQATLGKNGSREAIDIADYMRRYWAEIAPHLVLARTEADIDAVTNNVQAQIELWRNDGVEIGGIFIDYLQLLHYPAIRAHSRTDEVKGVCDRLNDMAKATKLPVILAAQFNRDATKAGGDKLDGIELANIGESAGIENIAEDAYLVYQIDKINPDGRDYHGTDGNKPFAIKPSQYRSKRCFTDENNADTLRRGYLYVENLKARDYATGGYCLLKFNGAAGAIISDKSEY